MKLKLDPASLPWLRSPAVQISAAGAAGLILLVLSAVIWVAPQQELLDGIDQDIRQLQATKGQVENIPVPVKATKEQLIQALEQVPNQEESARLVSMLKASAEQSKVSLTSIVFGIPEADSKDKLEDLITKASQVEQANAASPSPGMQPAPTPVPTAAASPKVVLPFPESPLEVEVSGLYGQTMDFLGKLYQQPRILQVKEWAMSPVNRAAQGSGKSTVSTTPNPHSTPTQAGEVPVTLKLKLAAYTSPQYTGKLTELPVLEASPGSQRKDPTWSDAMMWELNQ
ncbi:hypothetical protein [Gorillibacterium sp. sgz5001074]|uniref:hypothetical protein n=1 Tax=Gorillibacterium sp. sgz5001074 TaxID=3446695 RepID=UPI003F67C731